MSVEIQGTIVPKNNGTFPVAGTEHINHTDGRKASVILEEHTTQLSDIEQQKANDTDNTRTTTSKSVTGAINELNSNKADKTEVNSLATNKAEDSRVTVISTKVDSLANGSPEPVSLVSQMTDITKPYLYTGNEGGYVANNWYYWNGSAWVSGGQYGLGVANNSISIEKTKNKAIAVEKTNFINRGKNLLDEDNVLLNYYMEVDGVLVPSTNYCITDYIPCSNGDNILLWRNTGEADPRRGIRIATFFDENYNVLSSYGVDNSALLSDAILASGGEIAHVKLSFNKGYIDGKTIIEKSQTPTTFEKYYCQIKKMKLSDETLSYLNPLYGKKIMGFGDSIMRGAGNSDVGIVDILGTRNNMTVTNNAVSGATILADTTNNIPLQITNASGSPDYIVLDGYINDVLLNGILDRLGSISPYFGSVFDTNTFCGQMETMLRELSTKFIGSKFLYVFVHHMNTRDDQVVKQIHSLAKQICAKWGIPIVDLYENGILNTYIEGYRTPYTGNGGDGTHPNQLGYDEFYIPQIEATLKTL